MASVVSTSDDSASLARRSPNLQRFVVRKSIKSILSNSRPVERSEREPRDVARARSTRAWLTKSELLASVRQRSSHSRKVTHSPASEAKRGSRRSSVSENGGGGARDQLARRQPSARIERALRTRRALSPGLNVSRRFSWCQAPPPASRTSSRSDLPRIRRFATAGEGSPSRDDHLPKLMAVRRASVAITSRDSASPVTRPPQLQRFAVRKSMASIKSILSKSRPAERNERPAA